MFGVIASSSGCKGPGHSNRNKHGPSNHDNHQLQRRCSQDKVHERETFITSEEVFQIIANKRNSELRKKQPTPQCINTHSSLFTPQAKGSHNKDKESSTKKYGVSSISQAVGASMSCMGSEQFVRDITIKASTAPKT